MALRQKSDLARRAERLIPGGVNSPVRAMRSVGLDEPVFVRSGSGSTIEDVDGNRYVDWVLSWGPLLFGHADEETLAAIADAAQRGTTFGAPTEGEVELAAEIVDAVPSVEMVRLVSSGTEAAMCAIRLARGFTRRDRIIKFAGCYHGHSDGLLASAGSGLATLGIPSSPGVPTGTTSDTVVTAYNDLDATAAAVERYGEGLAAIVVEPVAGNMGVVPPAPGFLEALRALCDASGALLIFDEVITGFRVARGGAQERFGVFPDLRSSARSSAAACRGRLRRARRVMERLAPAGAVYQAGTLSGNPLATAAGISVLRRLRDPRSSTSSSRGCARHGSPPVWRGSGRVQRVGAMLTLFCQHAPSTRLRRHQSPLGYRTVRGTLPAPHRAGHLRRAVAVPVPLRLARPRRRGGRRHDRRGCRPLRGTVMAVASSDALFDLIAGEAARGERALGRGRSDRRSGASRFPCSSPLVSDGAAPALASRRSTRGISLHFGPFPPVRACRRRPRPSCSATTCTRTGSCASRPRVISSPSTILRSSSRRVPRSAPRASPATATPGSPAPAASPSQVTVCYKARSSARSLRTPTELVKLAP